MKGTTMIQTTGQEANELLLPGGWTASTSYCRLLFAWLSVAIACKGMALAGGYAVDDYYIASGDPLVGTNFAQQRYIQAALLYLLQLGGLNMVDLGPVAVGLVILLHVLMVGSVLKFLSIDCEDRNLFFAGALMLAHPYTAEIYTWRVAMLSFGVALASIVLSLELVRQSRTLISKVGAVLSITVGLLTYQVVLNYIAAVIILSMLFACVLPAFDENNHRRDKHISRAYRLSGVLGTSILLYVIVTFSLGQLLHVTSEPRAVLIHLKDVPARFEVSMAALKRIFLDNEPVLGAWMKRVQLLLLMFSCFQIALSGRWRFTTKSHRASFGLLIVLMLCCLPLSLGVIIFFNSWWPVPRVTAHMSLIIGAVAFLPMYLRKNGNYSIRTFNFVSPLIIGVLLCGFTFANTAIFADQRRINDWDRSMGIRMVARLESLPKFREVQAVHIVGTFFTYPSGPLTVQGDLNVSALGLPAYHTKVLNAVTGYRWREADEKEQEQAKQACRASGKWPDPGSIFIQNHVGVVCI